MEFKIIEERYEFIPDENKINIAVSEEVVEFPVENIVEKIISGADKIEKEFTYEDLPEVSIGSISANKRIYKVVLIIQSEFDSGLLMTIGDDDGNGRLMNAANNNPETVNYYSTEPEYSYENATELKIYSTGAATKGEGLVIIYYS